MKSGLLIASAGNIDTFTNVLWALSKHIASSMKIGKVLLLDSGDTLLSLDELKDRIHIVLGTNIEMRVRRIDSDPQSIIPKVVSDGANEVGSDFLVVDLTTGTKTISAVLYACASFSQLSHLYYISVDRGDKGFFNLWNEIEPEKKHEVFSFAPLKDVHELASHSFFDLIFYREELDKIDEQADNITELAASVREVNNYLRTALPHFFGKSPDFLSAMRSIGAARERLQPLVLQAACLVARSDELKTLKQLDDWSEKYRDSRLRQATSETAQNIAGTFVMDTGLRTLQSWRNRASHTPPPEFKQSDIRTAMAMALTLLETVVAVHASEERET